MGDVDFLIFWNVLLLLFCEANSTVGTPSYLLSRDLQEQPLRLEGTGLKLGEARNSPRNEAFPFNKSEHLPFAFEADVWSLGVVLYEMCCLKAEIKMQPDLVILVCVVWIWIFRTDLWSETRFPNCALQVPFQASNLPAMALQICTMDFKTTPRGVQLLEKKSDELSASEKASILYLNCCFSNFFSPSCEDTTKLPSFLAPRCAKGPDLHALVHQLLQKACFSSCEERKISKVRFKKTMFDFLSNDVWFFVRILFTHWINVWDGFDFPTFQDPLRRPAMSAVVEEPFVKVRNLVCKNFELPEVLSNFVKWILGELVTWKDTSTSLLKFTRRSYQNCLMLQAYLQADIHATRQDLTICTADLFNCTENGGQVRCQQPKTLETISHWFGKIPTNPTYTWRYGSFSPNSNRFLWPGWLPPKLPGIEADTLEGATFESILSFKFCGTQNPKIWDSIQTLGEGSSVPEIDWDHRLRWSFFSITKRSTFFVSQPRRRKRRGRPPLIDGQDWKTENWKLLGFHVNPQMQDAEGGYVRSPTRHHRP